MPLVNGGKMKSCIAKIKNSPAFLIGLLLQAGLGLPWSGRADYYVATNGAHGSFTNWEEAATNIQAAIDAATNGATIWVSNGVYVATSVVRSNATVVLEKPVTLRSVNGPAWTVMDAAAVAGDERIVLYVYHSGAVVDGFTIRGGHLTNSATLNYWLVGGGVQLYLAGLVRNCHITSNTAFSGGGAHIRGYGRMENCWIYGNTAVDTSASGGGVRLSASGGQLINCVVSNNFSRGYGGGIAAANNGTISVCTVVGNLALDRGGGIYANGSPLITDDTLIAHNRASGNGGGVYVQNARLYNCRIVSNHAYYGGGVATPTAGGVISNCHIADNVSTAISASGGGGVYLQGGLMSHNRIVSNRSYNVGGGISMDASFSTSRNCLVAGNLASNQGGGIYFGNSVTALVESCTIAGNTATNGGGVYYAATSTRRTMLDNSIVYHNTATVTNADANQGFNDTVSNTCISTAADWPDAGNIADPPLFAEQAAGNYRLQALSPCINAGANQFWMTNSLDLDGYPRLDRNSRLVDMGCYEHVFRGTFFRFR